ncbi:MAG: peptidoglycan-binding domain-containing protein [Cyanobacteria bacterium P01_A01_bin.45]
MTGVLTTGQSSLPNSPLSNLVEEPPVQVENQNADYFQDSLSQEDILAQVTPPEFVKPQLVYASSKSWNLALKQESILKMVREKVHSHQFSHLLGLRIGAKKIQQQVMSARYLRQIKSKQMESKGSEIILPRITEKPIFLEELPLKIFVTANTQNLSSVNKNTFDSRITNPRKAFIAGGVNRPSRRIARNSPSLPILRFGNSGLSVKVLQKLLLSNGYAVRVDGFFGALTEAAVKGFQDTQELSVDGVVGGNTWDALSEDELF